MRFGPLDSAKIATWIGIAVVLFLLIIIALAAGAPRLIVLHGVDHTEILVNPEQVTTLRESARKDDDPNKLFTKEVECAIGLSNGKFVTVVETCEAARKLIEGTEK